MKRVERDCRETSKKVNFFWFWETKRAIKVGDIFNENDKIIKMMSF